MMRLNGRTAAAVLRRNFAKDIKFGAEGRTAMLVSFFV